MLIATALSTTHIETILLSLSYRRMGRYESAIEELTQAVEQKSIYNQALQSVKYELKHGIEAAAESLTDQIHPAVRKRGGHTWVALYNHLDSYFGLNAAAGRAKRLRKNAADLIASIPALGAYVALLDEVAQVNQAITSLKPFVLKGRRPSENPKQVDLSNTGTCAICENTQKLTPARNLVHHGFRISDGFGHYIGQRIGTCFGVGRKPYELSCAANKDFKKVLEASLVKVKQRVADLKAGKVKELSSQEWERVEGRTIQVLKLHHEGDAKFPSVLEHEIYQTERNQEGLERGIERQTTLIVRWTLKPLYDELYPKE
jgi:hypothetical protein